MTTSEDTIAALRRVPVFAPLRTEDIERIAQVAVPRRFQAGEIVFREGEQSDTCYIVRSGRARAVREHPAGRSITLASFGPGDMFGELAMFGGVPRSSTVDALEDMEVTAILGGDMRRLIREQPQIGLGLLTALANRLRDMNKRLARRSFQTVQSRVASVLLELIEARRELIDADGTPAAGANGTPSAKPDPRAGDGILITATQAELGQAAGSSRESASRFLAALERAGVITQGRGRLVVHDPEALERYVY